jgi:hypothetical protein
MAVIFVVILGRMWKAAVDRGGPGPAEPFRIAGNFYYVGADAVSAFLLTGPEGHVLLDGGYPSTAPLIIASIAKLGFDIKDVKVILNSIPAVTSPEGWPPSSRRLVPSCGRVNRAPLSSPRAVITPIPPCR